MFNRMKIADLKAICEEFAVDYEEGATRPVIIQALSDNGVTWDMALEVSAPARQLQDKKDNRKSSAPDADRTVVQENTVGEIVGETPAPAPVEKEKPQEKVLVRMDRDNRSFEIRGYKFTHSHPFVIVSAEDAEYLVEHQEGFSYATPKQASDFYS